jgi:hypothetical protein
MANQTGVGPAGPPLSYRIEDVAVRVQIQATRGLPVRQVTLSGNATGTLERGQQKSSFVYPSSDLLQVVNALYRIRFFNLQDSQEVRYSVFLKDGMVTTQALKMNDVGPTRVCFSAGKYEKCVSFVGDGPSELQEIVRDVFAQAERLAGVPAR